MRHLPSEPRRVLVLVGPTAAGKTAVALALATKLRCQIIGADARQVYRHLNIGTAKPSERDLLLTIHHCINIRDPDESYSAAEYAIDARAAIAAIPLTSLPIVVGGSGLYIQAALDGFSADIVATDPHLRGQVIAEFEERGREAMYEELQRVDPRAATRYSDRNPRRIQRALEFFRTTNRRLSSTWDSPKDPANVQAIYIGITQEKSRLEKSISDRSDQMWLDGLLEETQRVLESGVDPNSQSLRTVGYTEAMNVIQGRVEMNMAQLDLKVATRRYAKRQLTWFRRDARIKWTTGTTQEMVDVVWEQLQQNGWVNDFVHLQPDNERIQT